MALGFSKLHYTLTPFFTKFLHSCKVTYTATAVLDFLALAILMLWNKQ